MVIILPMTNMGGLWKLFIFGLFCTFSLLCLTSMHFYETFTLNLSVIRFVFYWLLVSFNVIIWSTFYVVQRYIVCILCRCEYVIKCDSLWKLVKDFSTNQRQFDILPANCKRMLCKALVLAGSSSFDKGKKEEYWQLVSTRIVIWLKCTVVHGPSVP